MYYIDDRAMKTVKDFIRDEKCMDDIHILVVNFLVTLAGESLLLLIASLSVMVKN